MSEKKMKIWSIFVVSVSPTKVGFRVLMFLPWGWHGILVMTFSLFMTQNLLLLLPLLLLLLPLTLLLRELEVKLSSLLTLRELILEFWRPPLPLPREKMGICG